METLRILFFNWRDLGHPNAGGAEVFIHEVAKRWAGDGHQVGLFCSRYPGSREEDVTDGVEIHRAGGQLSVYREARRLWRRDLSGKYDIVIDAINTRPFITPKFVDSGTEIFTLVFQLAREYWFRETPFPVNILGYYWLEKRWLSHYVGVPCVTISESTRRDLLGIGFRNVRIVPVGLSRVPLSEVPPKASTPTFIYLGRLTRAKRPEVALYAFKVVRRQFPNARLWVVGDGYLRKSLERKAPSGVTFFGKVTDDEKFRLLREAHAILVPGTREGWGLVVLEANAMATPAIAFDIPGLRDSVQNNLTGILLKRNTYSEMANWCVRLMRQPELARKLSKGALAWARRFSWDSTASRFMSILHSSASERAMPNNQPVLAKSIVLQ